MTTKNSNMTVLMNELNANIRQGFASTQQDFCAESQDGNENKIILFKSLDDYQAMLDTLDEEGTPYLLAVVVGRQKTEAEKRAEAVLEKAAAAREKKNIAQNKRRAKQAAEKKEAEAVVKKEEKKVAPVVDVSDVVIDTEVAEVKKAVVKKVLKKKEKSVMSEVLGNSAYCT